MRFRGPDPSPGTERRDAGSGPRGRVDQAAKQGWRRGTRGRDGKKGGARSGPAQGVDPRRRGGGGGAPRPEAPLVRSTEKYFLGLGTDPRAGWEGPRGRSRETGDPGPWCHRPGWVLVPRTRRGERVADPSPLPPKGSGVDTDKGVGELIGSFLFCRLDVSSVDERGLLRWRQGTHPPAPTSLFPGPRVREPNLYRPQRTRGRSLPGRPPFL